MQNHCVAILILVSASAHAVPQLESWSTAGAGAYARIYTTTANASNGVASTTWSRGSVTQSVPAYAGVQAVYFSTNWIYVRASGLAGYVMGPWYLDAARSSLFPNLPKNQATLWRMPWFATSAVTKTQTGLGSIGLFVDGVAMFDSRDGFYWNGTAETGGGGTGYWNRDAYVNEGITFDPANAHQEQSGTYHYHANPPALRHQLGDHMDFNTATRVYSESTNPLTTHSPILGWVRDGSPVYGPYAYSNAMDPGSAIVRMRSGYQLRNGQQGTDNISSTGRAYLPQWATRLYGVTSNVLAGPAVNGTYPAGRYMEDNAYLGDLGWVQGVDFDLDEYNGRFCVTPDFPDGIYAYFVSITSNGAPLFPYNIGRAYRGTPSGGTVTSITEPVSTNYAGPVQTPPEAALRESSSTLTLTWSALEGGTYLIERTTNLADWATVTNISAGATNTGSYAAGGDAGGFYRVTRVALSNYDGSATTVVTGNGILYMTPSNGLRGTTIPFSLTLPATAPPANAPVVSLTIGTNIITGAQHPVQTSVTGLFTIAAGAATGPQDIVLVWPGPPANPTARVTNSLPGGFTIL